MKKHIYKQTMFHILKKIILKRTIVLKIKVAYIHILEESG